MKTEKQLNHEGHEEHEGKIKFDALSREVIGCAIEVHRELGPGLLESAYQRCLEHEMNTRGLAFQMEMQVPLRYKDARLDCGFRVDFIVEKALILELKSVDKLTSVHQAQLLTYMKLCNCQTGLLMNFNVKHLRDGIKRFVL